MARNDQPGFSAPTPNAPNGFDAHYGAMTAPGSQVGGVPDTYVSAPDSLEAGTTADSAVITPPGASLVNAARVPVGQLDTLTGNQAQAYGTSPDPLTGIGAELGQTGAGAGHVVGNTYPGSRT
jgi:hypothetical protein